MHPSRDSLWLSAAETPPGMYFLSEFGSVGAAMTVYGRYMHGIRQSGCLYELGIYRGLFIYKIQYHDYACQVKSVIDNR